MIYSRINGRIDVDTAVANGNIKIDEEEQRGARPNKFWFNNYEYMYKDVYAFTHEDYAELIASKLAQHLGIKCAVYDLASYHGNKGVITKNLVNDNENEELLSGSEIITQVYSEYIIPIIKNISEYKRITEQYNAKNAIEFSKLSVDEQISLRNELLFLVDNINNNNNKITSRIRQTQNIVESDIVMIYDYLDSYDDIYNQDFTEMRNGIIKSNNLYDIWNVLEIYARINNLGINIEKAMDDLINMFIFDIITSQGDRHADNWAVIRNYNSNSIMICPLYDNSGICCLNRTKAVKNIVEYVVALNNTKLHENKKQRIYERLDNAIEHSNSGLKVDLIDVEEGNKNRAMMSKFMDLSSQEFISKIIDFTQKINDNILDNIFLEIETQTGVEMPNDVKITVKTVISYNIKMIEEIYNRKEMQR